MTVYARPGLARPRSSWRGAARLWLFIGAVAAASVSVWNFNLHHFDPLGPLGGIEVPWWGLAVAFYLAEAYVVHLQFRKQAHTLSFTEIGLVLGLFFVSPSGLLAAQVRRAALALLIHRRQRPIKLALQPRRDLAVHRHRAPGLSLSRRGG